MVSATVFSGIEHFAHLVEVSDLHVGAQAHAARIGRERAEDQAEDRGLAGAVGADQAEAVAARDDEIEVFRRCVLPAKILLTSVNSADELSGSLALADGDLHLADALAARRALIAQPLQPPHAALVARAPRLDPLADPDLLLRPELVELALRHRLGGELRRLGLLVGREISRERQQPPAVELDDARGDAVEEGAIVRHHDRRWRFEEDVLEQHDAVDVEMVRRLVEQQQIRLLRKGVRKRRSLPLATRHRLLDFDLEQVKELVELVRLDVGALRHHGFLLDPHDLQPVHLLQHAIVERDRPGEDAEERRLTGSVAADEPYALAGLHRQRGAVEERKVAVMELGFG